MTKARDLANIISGGFTEADIPNLSASKITSGTFADARIAASNVTQHTTDFDDDNIVNDISTLGLRQASDNNKAAYNTNSNSVDVFQDDTGIDTETNTDRNSNEYVSSVVSTTAAFSSDADTEFLAHFDGTDGATATTDSSSNSITISANGGVNLSTTQKKFGTASAYFDGTSDRYAVSANSAFNHGTNDWTYECWFYSEAASTTQVISNLGTHDQASQILMRLSSDNTFNFEIRNSSSTQYTVNTGSWSTNTWTHLAFTRDGNTMRVYKDGTQMDTITGFTGDFGSSSKVLNIGAFDNEGSSFNGYIDEYRVSSTCRYPNGTAFTPSQTTTVNATGNFTGNTITAPASVSSMGAIITYQDQAGTNTLNTDIVLKLSANSGTNYSTATLTAMPDFATGIKMAKVNDLSVTAGTGIKYKIEFANQASGTKEARIRGVSLQY